MILFFVLNGSLIGIINLFCFFFSLSIYMEKVDKFFHFNYLSILFAPEMKYN